MTGLKVNDRVYRNGLGYGRVIKFLPRDHVWVWFNKRGMLVVHDDGELINAPRPQVLRPIQDVEST